MVPTAPTIYWSFFVLVRGSAKRCRRYEADFDVSPTAGGDEEDGFSCVRFPGVPKSDCEEENEGVEVRELDLEYISDFQGELHVKTKTKTLDSPGYYLNYFRCLLRSTD